MAATSEEAMKERLSANTAYIKQIPPLRGYGVSGPEPTIEY